MRNLGILLLIALVVYCLVDISRSDDAERVGLHPALWMILVVLLPVVGPIIWLVVSRSHRPRQTRSDADRPASPDDDPDFLWRLSQQQRRRAAGRPAAAPPTATPDRPAVPEAPGAPPARDTPDEDGHPAPPR